MTGLGRKGETEVECPFCRGARIKLFHKEGYMQAKTSRISAGAKQTLHRVPDTYEVLEDCPACGKTRKEIEDVLEGRTSLASHDERLKRLKRSGLPTRIEG